MTARDTNTQVHRVRRRLLKANGQPEIITLPGGQRVTPWSLKCNTTGCTRRKFGYLTVETSNLGGGAFYDKRGTLLADLREKVFVCSEHGITDGSEPFLVEDP